MTSPAFLHRRSPVFTGRAIATSSSPLVTRVGLRVLEQGGNAADAAVAMAGMLALAEPMMSGLGGDTMVLVWSAKDQKVFGLNGSGRAPSGASLERIGAVPVMPEHGAASITIPGAVDGWCALLERFGTQSLQQLWDPVIAYARGGIRWANQSRESGGLAPRCWEAVLPHSSSSCFCLMAAHPSPVN